MSVPRPRTWWPIFRETSRLWLERDAFTQAAALAFFALFSLAPVLVLFEVGAGLLFEASAVRTQILSQFELLMGHEQALAVDTMLGRAAFEATGLVARVLGTVTFVVGTLAVFVQLQDSLNKMWDVAPKPGPLIRHLLWKRVISFALVLALGFVLVVSLVLSTTIQALQNYAERYFDVPTGLFDTGNAIVTYMLVTVLFAFIYRVLPDVEIPWRDVWVGAIVTSLLLSVGKWAIGFYLGRSDLAREYGTAGSMMVLLFWVYYASLLILFGAVFTRVQSAHFHPTQRPPERGAHRVVEKKVPA
jgi:membrane protein